MIKYAQFVLWDDCVGHVEPVPGLFLMWFILDKYCTQIVTFYLHSNFGWFILFIIVYTGYKT